MGVILCSCSNKGGTGKTTIATNTAVALANKGKTVLLVDADSQCNTTRNMFGVGKPEYSLYNVFKGHEVDISRCIYPTSYDNVFILPNLMATALLEIKYHENVKAAYPLLRSVIRDYVKANYDYAIIDTPPNLGLFLITSLFTADGAVIPVECGSQYSLDGLQNLVAFVQKISQVQKDLTDIRIILNKADRRTSASKATIQAIRKGYSEFVFDTVIPLSTSIEQAEIARTTVLRHAGTTPAAKAFRQFAQEIMETFGAD